MLRALFLFLIISLTVRSQDPDTLLTSLLQTENDTLRANQLYTQGFDLIDKDPQLAYLYAQNCQKAALAGHSLRHISKSYNLLGILYFKNGEFSKSLDCFENYLTTSKTINNTLGVAFAYTNLGHIYLQTRKFQDAEKYYLKALEFYNLLNNKVEVANGLINLGVLKNERQQQDAAFECFQKALQTGNELNNYEIKAICLNNMAHYYFEKREFEKSLALNYDALELRDMMGLDVDRADSYLSIAENAVQLNNPLLAKECLDTAFTLCNKTGYSEGIMNYYKALSNLEALNNNYQDAYAYLIKYTQMRDSLVLSQDQLSEFDFNELETIESYLADKPYKNTWLFILLFIMITFISYSLFRLKR